MPSRGANLGAGPTEWTFAGLASLIPNIEPSTTDKKTRIAKPPPDPWDDVDPNEPPPPCRILKVSEPEGPLQVLDLQEAQDSVSHVPQVLVFRYRGKIHAIDHSCPHQSYALSRGSVYDIEDFGITLSAGIVCPKHGWAFDLHTGQADTGRYQLGVYEVDIRSGDEGDEVWVRKKSQK